MVLPTLTSQLKQTTVQAPSLLSWSVISAYSLYTELVAIFVAQGKEKYKSNYNLIKMPIRLKGNK